MYIIHNVFIWVLALYTFLLMQLDCALMLYNSMCTLLSYFIFIECTTAAHVYRGDSCDGTKWLPSQSTASTKTHLLYQLTAHVCHEKVNSNDMSCICYVFLSMHKLSINIQSENVVGCICVFILRPVTYLFVLYTSTGWWKRSLGCSQPYSMWYSFCCFWSSSFPFLVNMYCHL